MLCLYDKKQLLNMSIFLKNPGLSGDNGHFSIFRVCFMVQYEWCFPLVRVESILSSKGGKTTPDLDIPTTIFNCGFEPLWYHSLSYSSPHVHPSATAINLKLGFNNEKDFSFPMILFEVFGLVSSHNKGF